jgi:hypothetical protein
VHLQILDLEERISRHCGYRGEGADQSFFGRVHLRAVSNIGIDKLAEKIKSMSWKPAGGASR